MSYPMIDGGSAFQFRDVGVLMRKALKKFGIASRNTDDTAFNESDKAGLTFDEFPDCVLCGSDDSESYLTANDDTKLRMCRKCTHVFTSPRPKESAWEGRLGDEESRRNQIVTENRLRYGVALERNRKFSVSWWWRRVEQGYRDLIDKMTAHCENPPKTLHDVGCGVGYSLVVARKLGLQASGNDLNSYAMTKLTQEFALSAHLGKLEDLVGSSIAEGSIDLAIMRDVIEHVYYPDRELQAIAKVMRPGGILYIETFVVDCDLFREHGASWQMLMWNHVHHFNSDNLKKLVETCGFQIKEAQINESTGMIEMYAARA